MLENISATALAYKKCQENQLHNAEKDLDKLETKYKDCNKGSNQKPCGCAGSNGGGFNKKCLEPMFRNLAKLLRCTFKKLTDILPCSVTKEANIKVNNIIEKIAQKKV